jgi:hypothetical protein
MRDLNSYLAGVLSYWNEEYPGKDIGDLEEKGPVRALVANCRYLNWPVPRCCARINEIHFRTPAAKRGRWNRIPWE